MCIVFVYTLLKGVSYYDFSVLSMSVMSFQKSLDGGCVCGCGVYVGLHSVFYHFTFLPFLVPQTSDNLVTSVYG